jgi:hypothetical protein
MNKQLYDSYAEPRSYEDKSYALPPLTALRIAREVAGSWPQSEVLLMNLTECKWSSMRHLEADHVIACLLEEIEQRARDVITSLQPQHAAGRPQCSMRHPGMHHAAMHCRPNLQLTVQVFSIDRDYFMLDQFDRRQTQHPQSVGVSFQLCNFFGRPLRQESCNARAYARWLALEGKQQQQGKGKKTKPALENAAAETPVLCYDRYAPLGPDRQTETMR